MSSSPGRNQFLSTNEFLVSPRGTHYLTIEGNGNLVVYKGSGPQNQGQMPWQSGTAKENGEYFAAMQEDGNLVIYKGKYPEHFSASYHIWSSQSSTGTGNYFVSITYDGKLQICTGSGPDDNPGIIGPN